MTVKTKARCEGCFNHYPIDELKKHTDNNHYCNNCWEVYVA